MKKEIIRTDKAPNPSGAYSQAVKLGNMVYVAGTCPFELETGKVLAPGDIGAQTRIVLSYMQEILKAAGSSMDNVVKVTAFVDDLDQFQIYNQAYGEFFQHEPPARSTFEIGKFPVGMCVEIECIAFIEEDHS
ncbi:RidA family protein [Paenibacillus eucommiae]|uniref:2-iminobutanoate/2-iminopropanoate deaminase n=1 Tax=Paenibacillus eucommiae TaxID=1355755 RepID=A0ABS4IML6_9BACL|nr:RidA family protein [Paenibacillus eucommiae]MBP1988753.1 2-iminobutanoate/2-iminopropanoate deaminase [Paenibacillus eucommiae]